MQGIWIIAFIFQWILVLVLCVLMIGILRYLRFIQKNIHHVVDYGSRFEEGDKIDDFELSDLNGLITSSNTILNTKQKTLLFFVSTTCSACVEVVEYLGSLAKHSEGLKRFEWQFVLIYTSSLISVKSHVDPLLLNQGTILIDEEEKLYRQYDIRAFPTAIAVDEYGKVVDQAVGSVSTWLRSLLHVSPNFNIQAPTSESTAKVL